MPLIRNKHQPYFPDPDSPNNFNCGSERYCHPFNGDDTFMTQFYQTPCNDNEVIDPEFDDYTLSSELLANPDFDDATLNLWYSGASPLSTTLGVIINGWTGANPNRVEHALPLGFSLNQTGLGFIFGEQYQITVDFDRSAGSIELVLGNGAEENSSGALSTSGTYTFDLVYTDTINDIFQIRPTSTFIGYINSVSVKQKIFDYWATNSSWQLAEGLACHIEGTTGDLKDTSPNYIDANGYYVASFTLSDYVQGSINFYISDILVGTINQNGTFTYYATPTLAGTIKFEPSIDFIGCISNPSCYELRNDYTAFIVDENGTEFDISDYIEYFEQYVTIKFDFVSVGNYELPNGCYYVKLYDQCIITSDNLVFNGDFVDGYSNWTRNNATSQYDVTGDEMKFIFSPFTIGGTDFVTNGDFSSGSAWVINAGWSIAGAKAIHTPGNTGTLFQTMTLPAPPLPATSYNYWVTFTVTNWTAGTITLKLGNAVNGTTYTWKGNDTFLQIYNPRQSGSVDITFTPSITFDGEIDNVACVVTNHSAFPFITNTNQPLITPGTYDTGWEIIGSSDPKISVKAQLNSSPSFINYQTAIGTYSFTQTYGLNGGTVGVVANFGKTSVDYVQTNYIVGYIIVDNVSLTKIEPFDATYETECLSVNLNGWDKTKMIVAWCDQPSFGFEFANTGFKLQQRALIRSINPSYPKEKSIQRMGNGDARIVYSEIEKFWEVHTDFASETFHDAMVVQLDCDHLQIGDTQGDGKEYISSADEYTPNWQGDGTYSLATATFELRIKEKGQIFNRHI